MSYTKVSSKGPSCVPVNHLIQSKQYHGVEVAPPTIAPASGSAGLGISQPGDANEREADRIAAQIVPGSGTGQEQKPNPTVTAVSSGIAPKGDPASEPNVNSGLTLPIQRLSGQGAPLPEPTRAFFEKEFNSDFEAVRVHTGGEAQQMAGSINARAFTVNNHLVFGPGQYAPESAAGKKLLAHELTHVVQQSQNPNAGNRIDRFGEKQHDEIETEAFGNRFNEEERKQIALGNWMTDFNQISLALEPVMKICEGIKDLVPDSILNRIGLPREANQRRNPGKGEQGETIPGELTQNVGFEIAKIMAEAKFGEEIARNMTPDLFGYYKPKQHFDNPNDAKTPLGNQPVEQYIRDDIQNVKAVFRMAIHEKNPVKSRVIFGNAMHTMEDFFAHTNFTEIALACLARKGGSPLPETGQYQLRSGNFGNLDTVVSILKIIQGKLQEPALPNQRSTGNRILLVLLKRLNPRLAEIYGEYLSGQASVRRKMPFSIRLLQSLLGIVKQKVLSSFATVIAKLTQKIAPKTKGGMQPSHTTINKDEPGRPNYEFAKRLAVHVDQVLTECMGKIWAAHGNQKAQDQLFALIDEYTAHPVKTKWWRNLASASSLSTQTQKKQTAAKTTAIDGKNGPKTGLIAPEANLRPAPSTDNRPLKLLPFNTKVQILNQASHGWYHVRTAQSDTGYVAATLVKTGLPEPGCILHRVAGGESAIGIAERYYKNVAQDLWQDLRYYVNVLVFVNQGMGNPAKGIYTPKAGDGWEKAQVTKGAYIWIPSVAYAKSLKGAFEKILDKTSVSLPLVGNAADFAGFLYDPVQSIFYSKMDPQQRKAGYFPAYDAGAPLAGMLIDSEPIQFRYDNRDWKIELWKGQYGIATGAEIGIYTGEFQLETGNTKLDQQVNKLNFGTDTACAGNNDLLQMSFALKKQGKVLFSRSGKHWWLTGFKPGELSKPSDLTMDIAITLKDAAMRQAFVDGLIKIGYRAGAINWSGNTVSFTFGKPKTPQPLIKRKVASLIGN